ncbi:MAG: hypothetical protein DLM58_16540 [Pseudonocardiales bacterium]|nr:MAG: hypothetical protein DLM58_16540 [Pseudonocardiales bacterium]
MVVDRTANTRTGSRLDDFTSGAVLARYVRLTVTGVYRVATSWVGICEFGIYDGFRPAAVRLVTGLRFS